ncbi:unnamed protein product [Medioppia subpectinata]|uniref:Uncharacterized protein n=1 Tax=Medioppia subpectinata TaxID=1979941 RepID=A0A7R9L3S2_9ACAR|nr:unnamed protein product [Medioppia subpectinata]CAG2114872.1 unnamed protein product [Medioppia subpectinata]
MGGPHVRQPKSKLDTTGSSDSSNEQTFAYTRDRLLGAVEKVRSGMLLARASPYRHEEGTQTPTSLQTPSQTPIDKALLEPPDGPLRQRRPTPVRFADDNDVFIDDNQTHTRYRAPHPPSRTSMTSMSSGRGSSGHDGSGKTTSLSHSRGDSFQNSPQSELQSTSNIIDKTASSSSGIVSATLSSNLHSSTSPGQSSGISASSVSGTTHRRKHHTDVQSLRNKSFPHKTRYAGIESPQSEPIFPSYAPPMEPLDVSVDENYEFDSISPLEAELIEKLRGEQQRWRQWQQHRRPPPHHQQSQPLHYPYQSQPQQHSQRTPFSDSEVYGIVSSRRRHEDADARCAALKEEFFRFRRRQQYLQQQQHNDTRDADQSSSDEFESAC